MPDVVFPLPLRPSLEQLRKQAKELLKQFDAGEKAAFDRFCAIRTRFDDKSGVPPSLADAQFVIAREYGFADWAKLKEQVAVMRASGPFFVHAKVPFYTIDWVENRISIPGPQSDQDWDTVEAVMRENKITKLLADRLSDTGLERLAGLSQLTHLNIAGAAQVTDDSLRNLARMPHLQDLDFGGGNSLITNGGLQILNHLPGLRRFKACWTPGISDVGLAGLNSCELLEDVNLLGTKTGDGVLTALAGKCYLRRFQSGKGVTDLGLKLLQQIPRFRTWHGGELQYGLMTADAEPNYLLLDGPFSDSGLASLRALEGLFALSLFWHCPAFTSDGLEPLKDLPRLGFFGCQDDHCDDRAMQHIAAFPQLRMLMAQDAVATDAGFEALSRSKSLEYVWGRRCPHFTGRGLAALSSMPALRGIAISCKNVSDALLSKLADFPSLREIVPMNVNDAGFRHLGRCEDLEALWCMYCSGTGDTATEHIAQLPRLKGYYAGQTQITDRSLQMLGRMNSLERLEFWKCAGLTNAGIAELVKLPRLREVSLNALPGLTRQAASMFASRVRMNYSAA